MFINGDGTEDFFDELEEQHCVGGVGEVFGPRVVGGFVVFPAAVFRWCHHTVAVVNQLLGDVQPKPLLTPVMSQLRYVIACLQ